MSWPPKLSPVPEVSDDSEEALVTEVTNLRGRILEYVKRVRAIEEGVRKQKREVQTLANEYEDKVLRLRGQLELPFEEQA